MSKRRSLFSDGVWVASTQTLAALGQLLGIRVLTEILPPAVFGKISLWLGVVALVASGLANPTMQALLRFYPEYAAQKQGIFVCKAASHQLLKLLLFCTPFFIPLMWVAIVYGWTDIITLLLLIALVAADIIRMKNMAVLNAICSQREFGLWAVAEAWGRPILAWVAITYFGITAQTVLAAYLFTSLGIWLVMRNSIPQEELWEIAAEPVELPKKIWRYTLPLLPLGLLGWISGMADRYIIGSILTTTDVGKYVAIYGLASRPMLMLGTILETTISPVYQQTLVHGDHSEARKYLHKWWAFVFLGSSLAVLISINGHQLLARFLLGEPYRGVSHLLPWIVGGYALLVFSGIPIRACYANGATVSILSILITDSLLAVTLGYIFINTYGLIGAAIAVPIYYGIRLSLATYCSRKYLFGRKSTVKISSSLLLSVAKIVPRGYWRIIRYAALRDPTLWNYPLELKHDNRLVLFADLRESVYTGIFRKGNIPHQRGLDIIFAELVRSGDTVFDVGANIGYTTLLLSSCVGATGKVIALEPSPRAYALLSRSLKETKNVILLNSAASQSNKKVTLYVPTALDLASQAETPGSKKVEVDAQSLDTISQSYGRPDLVKVDVEGFEADVFHGMKSLLLNERPPIIIFEALNRSAFDACRCLLNDLSLGRYIFFCVGVDGTLLTETSEKGSSDYVALPDWARERRAVNA